MEVTLKMLTAAMRRAVELKLIPATDGIERYIANWEAMEAVLKAALAEADILTEGRRAIGRQIGPKGGKARAAALSPERRSEIATRAAEARWAKREGGVPAPSPDDAE
jgi:hypothetical protein